MTEKNSLLKILGERVLVSDGAMGTMLQKAGLPPGGCPEIWNLEWPDEIRKIMVQYKNAGSDCLLTNSFGASPAKLAAFSLDDRCHQINISAARIGRSAAGSDAFVLGSIGPTGQLLQPLGMLSEDAAFYGFRIQAEALAEGGVHALCIETMTDLNEALIALKAAKTTGLPVIVTMTFEDTPRGFFTIMGNDIPSSVAQLEAGGADVVGSNCGSGSKTMLSICRSFQNACNLPLIIHSNAGLPVLNQGEIIYPESPDSMAAMIPDFIAAGVSIIGGCCGTGPDHIRAMAAAVRG